MDLLKKRGGIVLAGVLLLAGLLAYVVWHYVFAEQTAPAESWTALNEPMEQLLETAGPPVKKGQAQPDSADERESAAAGPPLPAVSSPAAAAGTQGVRSDAHGEGTGMGSDGGWGTKEGSVPGSSAAGAASSRQGASGEGRLELNTATPEQLDALPGIGVSKARAIVAYRAEAGPFKSVDELTNVKGIGDKLLTKLRPFVYVMPR